MQLHLQAAAIVCRGAHSLAADQVVQHVQFTHADQLTHQGGHLAFVFIASLLANRRKDGRSHPLAESMLRSAGGGRLTTTQDQGVEAGFVDDVGAALTTYVEHRPFVIVQGLHGLGGVRDAKRLANIASDKPRLTITQ
ncbi:hypothetical protein FQZ97_1067730 [compost metagenome]